MSKRLIIDIDCGNAAFFDQVGTDNDGERRRECAAILKEVVYKLESGYDGANMRDTNGNLVGVFHFINGRKRVRDH